MQVVRGFESHRLRKGDFTRFGCSGSLVSLKRLFGGLFVGFRRGWRVVQPGSSLPLGAGGSRGLWAGALRPAVSDRRPSTGSCVS